ncbi:MAG: hypothetical protein NTV00_08970 [Methylococcales bacterium]|nr:hypothetical protein [Methylococcales bacterium]
MRGAGGTTGGVGHFWLGLTMMCGGFYLLLKSIVVSTSFGLGYQLYGLNLFGSLFSITSGMTMIPFIFGIAMIFYNGRSVVGWALTGGALIALIFGVIASIHFTFISMSAFDLLIILVLAFGGLGLFLRSLAAA